MRITSKIGGTNGLETRSCSKHRGGEERRRPCPEAWQANRLWLSYGKRLSPHLTAQTNMPGSAVVTRIWVNLCKYLETASEHDEFLRFRIGEISSRNKHLDCGYLDFYSGCFLSEDFSSSFSISPPCLGHDCWQLGASSHDFPCLFLIGCIIVQECTWDTPLRLYFF